MSGAGAVVAVRALEPLTLAFFGVHGLPHLPPNSWPPPLHAEGADGDSSAPSGLQSQKCCLLWLSARNWQTSVTWTVRGAHDRIACPRQQKHLCRTTLPQGTGLTVFWNVYQMVTRGSPHLLWHNWRWCVTESRKIFKEKKRRNQHLWFPFIGRGEWGRKWQVERERGRNRSGVSLMLWFVGGQWGKRAQQVWAPVLVPLGGCEAWPEPHV